MLILMGAKPPFFWIPRCKPADEILERSSQRGRQRAARWPFRELADMNYMLTETVENGTGRRARIDGHMIAGKTGTTNDFRDAWFVGYAPDRVTAVWVGNDENKAMDKVTGGSLPAMIFKDAMTAQLLDMPAAKLPVSSEPDWAQKNVQLKNLLNHLEGQLP